MSHQVLRLSYTLTFESPFHLGSGQRRGMAHRSVCRDSDGLLYVPGSTVKGVVRQQAERIAELFALAVREPHVEGAHVSGMGSPPGIVDRIFGSRFFPGTVCFDDALLEEGDKSEFQASGSSQDFRVLDAQVEPRSRVALDRRTRTASQGHLFTSEYGLPGLRFRGRVGGVVRGVPLPSTTTPGAPTYSLLLLVSSLLAVDRLGADRSVGAGVCSVAIEELLWGGEPLDALSLLDQLGDLEYYEMAAEEEHV